MPKQLELFHQTCQYNDFFSDQFFLCYALYKRTECFLYFLVFFCTFDVQLVNIFPRVIIYN